MMGWRDRYRQRDKKRAAEIPQEEFAGCLHPTKDFPSGHILVGDEEQGYLICVWHNERGMSIMRSHDDAYCFVLIEHLLANGAPQFASRDEAEAFARERGWSGTSDGCSRSTQS